MPPKVPLFQQARQRASQREGRIPDVYSQLKVIEISVHSEANLVRKKLKAAGFDFVAERLNTRLETLSARILNSLSESALSAVKSKAPVFQRGRVSGVLRDDHIHLSEDRFRRGVNTFNLTRHVFIDKALHKSFHSPETPTASGLALYLDSDDLRRTGPSIAEGGYGSVSGSTSGWLSMAQNSFIRRKGSIVSSVISNF